MDIREHFQKFQLKSIIRKRKIKNKKRKIRAVTITPTLRQFLGPIGPIRPMISEKLTKHPMLK